MARARSSGNGEMRESIEALRQSTTALQQSVIMLNQSHAEMNQTQTALLARIAEYDREMVQLKRESDERFARIEATLGEMWTYLQALPETIREKIGFKPPQ